MIQSIKFYYSIIGFGGLFSAIKAKLTGSTVIFEHHRNDCKHPINLRIPSSDISTFKQVYIDKEYNFQVEESPTVIIDAGANIGLASIYFANTYPDAKIIAIEPERNNFEILKINSAQYSNIFPLQAALWHKNEIITLVDPGLGSWGFMTESQGDNSKNNACHPVDAITVDWIMNKYNLKKIDILKIDIEGAEKEVFSDTSSWMYKVDSLIVELHERMKPGCNRNFYSGTAGFDNEWHQGENVYLSRQKTLSKSTE